jgi:DNA (cytosine-5)-methyltransferase 1
MWGETAFARARIERNGMTHLDLFSGIGGFALAARWAGFETIAFCEIDDYAQKILCKNFGAQTVADTERIGETRASKAQRGKTSVRRELKGSCPIFRDIRQLDGSKFAGVTLCTGGFPCQPFSLAGKQRGAADDRHLWPEMLRVIDRARPAWVVAENVPGIVGMEFGNYLFDVASLDAAVAFGLETGLDPWAEIIGERILGLHSVTADLKAIGYTVQPVIVPACAVDAKHRRDRVWIVANCQGEELGEAAGAIEARRTV